MYGAQYVYVQVLHLKNKPNTQNLCPVPCAPTPSPGSSACVDCANLSFGESRLDRCGRCDANQSNNCRQDCRGAWGGALHKDVCNVCNGTGRSPGQARMRMKTSSSCAPMRMRTRT